MRRKSKRNFRTVIAVIGIVALLAIPSLLHEQRLLAARQAVRGQTTKPRVQQKELEWEKLTKQQFEQLPDSQPIKFEGKQTTLGEVRVKALARQKETASMRTVPARRNAEPRKIDSVLRTQQQKFAAENANVQTELKRLRQLRPISGSTTELKTTTPNTGGLTRLPPQITKVLGIIQPGGVVLLGGVNFGDKPGSVRMIVQNTSVDLRLENLEWYRTGIGGRIPNLPTVVNGAGARFVVETSSGQTSNVWLVNWVLEVRRLTTADLRVANCSQDGNINRCNSTKSSSYCAGMYSPVWVDLPAELDDSSIFASHTNCWGAAGDDSGIDVYEISLKNGWVLLEYSFESAVTDEGEGWVHGPSGFQKGSTSWKPSIAWSVTPSDTVAYWAYIYIHGPKGVSYTQQNPTGNEATKAQ
jgi:type II secretory pathway pseudopilin PulG